MKDMRHSLAILVVICLCVLSGCGRDAELKTIEWSVLRPGMRISLCLNQKHDNCERAVVALVYDKKDEKYVMGSGFKIRIDAISSMTLVDVEPVGSEKH